MTEPVSIPANLQELKQGLGEAILIELFAREYGKLPPDYVLRSARLGNNVEAADSALAQFPEQLAQVSRSAERALAYLPRGLDDAMISWMSDFLSSSGGALSLMQDIPGQYLGQLLLQAFIGENEFRRVMELFRDLGRKTER